MSWAAASLAVVALAVALQVISFERTRPAPRLLALVAALAALAVAGRLAFAPIPNVKPTTDIILIAGFALGASPGFAVGAVTALVSNMAFGQGPWTPWQMLAWGMVGVLGAAVAKIHGGRIGRVQLAAWAALAGVLFGVVMDVSQWLLYGGDPDTAKLTGFMLTSLPWNIAHAAGNAAFVLAFGPMLIAAVNRAKVRLEPRWMPLGARLEAVGLPALAAIAIATPFLGAQPQEGDRQATASAGSPVSWLLSAQNADGGFGSDRGGSSAPMTTAWSAIGLAAAGKRLPDVSRPGGLSVVERLMLDARSADEPGEEQRLVIAAVAAGADPGSFGGRDLVAKVAGRIGASGAVSDPRSGPAINLTAFAVIALEAAGAGGAKSSKAAAWLGRQVNADGGFGPYPGTASDVDDTAAVVQALAAAGRLGASTSSKAFAFISRSTDRSGGVRTAPPEGLQPNSQSTAWAAQAMIAAGRPAGRQIAWLRSRVGASGKVAYAPGSFQTPVWVTAQSLVAISGKALPLSAPAPASGAGGADGGGDSGSVDPAVEGDSGSGATAAEDRAKGRAAARRLRIAQGQRVAYRAAVTAGALVGAFVRAFGGRTR